MIKKDDLIEAVIDGILDANDFYQKISNGLWLSDAGVESVLQTKIAESIFDSFPKDSEGYVSGASIAMEHDFKKIIDESGSGKKRGRVPTLVSGAKRVDLLIFDSNEKPIVPIEIKRNVATEGFAKDALRIIGVLGRSDKLSGGSVKYGLICGFLFGEGDDKKSAEKDLKNKLSVCREKIENKISEQSFEFCYRLDDPVDFEDSGWWAGGAVCVYLRRAK